MSKEDKEEAAAKVVQAAQVCAHCIREAVKRGLSVDSYSDDLGEVRVRVYERQETTLAQHPPPARPRHK